MSLNSPMLRKIAILEGTTLILLVLIAVPLKRLLGYPEAVQIMGPIHGAAFLIYVAALSYYLTIQKLANKQWAIGLLAAFLPFGSYIFEQKVLKPLAL